jgi:uncharacterized membrane protein
VFRKHLRFLASFALGCAVVLAAQALPVGPAVRVLLGVNVFFSAYLLAMLALARTGTPAVLRRHADQEDEGVALIIGLAGLTVVISLGAIFLVLNAPQGAWAETLLAMVSVPLGWSMVHVLAGFHYAHLYYGQTGAGKSRADRAGLEFPGKLPPAASDFLYFSFVIGMTAQVSDVVVTDAGLRRVVLLHGIASFFYNTVIIAFAVNAAVQMGS